MSNTERRVGDASRTAPSDASAEFDVLLHSADAALILHPSLGVVYASPATTRVLGITPERMISSMAADFLHPDDVALAIHHREIAARVGRSGPEEVRGRHGDGEYRWFEAEWWQTSDVDEPLTVLHLRDATSARAARASIARSEARLSRLLRMSADVTMIIAADGAITYLSPSVDRILGWDADQALNNDPFDLIHPDDRPRIDEIRATMLHVDRSTYTGEVRVLHLDGRYRWMELNAVNLLSDPIIEGAIVHLHDVTDRRVAEEELSRQALTDALTGLPNFALLQNRIDVALTRRDVGRESGLELSDVAVFVCDLDAFSTLNDALGHADGDDVLREAARRLEAIAGRGYSVARIAGDEFAVCMEDVRHPQQALELADEARTLLSSPYVVGGQEHRLTCSVGLTIAGHDANAESLLRDAGAAMHAAKSSGRNRLEVFDPKVRSAVVRRMDLQSELDRALERDEFVLHYQPVYDTASGTVAATEALIRWNHPERGLLLPGEFIGTAEASHRIVAIGDWVIAEAARAAVRLGYDDPDRRRVMAVNVAAAQLAESSFASRLLAHLADARLDPECFGIEVTESALIDSDSVAVDQLRRIHDAGCMLALDDFGTGYSSLTYLQRFDVDAIKIDRSFVSGLGLDDDASSITAAVNGLGRALNLRVIAEGVETALQLELLEAMACSDVSGFGLARPMPEAELDVIIDQTLAMRRRGMADQLVLDPPT